MWVVAAVVEGQEDNVLYRRSASPDGDLEVVARHQLRAGDVLFIPDDGIHNVANPSRSPTVALHVFGGDIRRMPRSTWDIDGRGERPFDTETINVFIAEAEQQQIALGRPLAGGTPRLSAKDRPTHTLRTGQSAPDLARGGNARVRGAATRSLCSRWELPPHDQ